MSRTRRAGSLNSALPVSWGSRRGGRGGARPASVGDKSALPRERNAKFPVRIDCGRVPGLALPPRLQSSDMGEVAKHTSARIWYFPRNLGTRALHKFIYRERRVGKPLPLPLPSSSSSSSSAACSPTCDGDGDGGGACRWCKVRGV